MSDDLTKMMAQMMEQGQAMTKALYPDFDPAKMGNATSFADWMPTLPKDLMEAFMGKGLNPEGLDAKTRLLLTLGALTLMGAQVEDQLTLTVRHALEAGATAQEIAETIAQMGAFGAAPAMAKALKVAQAEIEKQREQRG
ncbi:MAG: 4-carboxymuconolactone decarboxylase [Paracoccaceae bacterium]|jgi:4-carboxymuconolactone decarboxylase